MKVPGTKIYFNLIIAILLSLQSVPYCFAARSIDSLRKVLKTQQPDTARVNTIDALVLELTTIGHYPQADSLIPEALSLSEKHNYKKGIAYADLRKGVLNYYQGLYPQALDCLFRSHKEFEEMKDQRGIALSILYIGYVYEGQADYKKALDKFNESSSLFAALNDDDYNATAIINIGNIYNNLLIDYTKAKDYYFRSLELFKKAGDDDGVASAIADIGFMFYHQKQYDSAMVYSQKGLALFEKINDTEGIAMANNLLGKIYYEERKYKEALECADKSRAMAKEIGSFADTRDAELLTSQVYLAMGEAMSALEHYKYYVSAKDSLTNQENTKKSVQAEMNFEFEKKQAALQAEQDKKDALQKIQTRKQQLTIYFISGILLLFLVIAIFAYRSYLQKQRDNKELDIRNKKIEAAYSIIEEKNREITDSINYAKRIQHAILPDRQTLESLFPQSFVLFKPKDIVSGDFYFLHIPPSGGGAAAVLAVADCTGHGVPGAFMSMIGSEKLHDAVQQSADTGKILSLLNKGIKTSLYQSGEQNSTRDGMDIALCAISLPNGEGRGGAGTLSFSGANRPLWIIRKGASEIEEIKPDKKAIGGFTEGEQGFESHTIQLHPGDSFYIFSDGYADQFGGPQGKKLSTKKFRELLLSIQNLSMPEQGKHLEDFIEKWRESREQLDDILVIGVRL